MFGSRRVCERCWGGYPLWWHVWKQTSLREVLGRLFGAAACMRDCLNAPTRMNASVLPSATGPIQALFRTPHPQRSRPHVIPSSIVSHLLPHSTCSAVSKASGAGRARATGKSGNGLSGHTDWEGQWRRREVWIHGSRGVWGRQQERTWAEWG